ncbi:MAG: PAS domain S-box protein [Deltaproteobacteria bacterium]|nr:PAS domain S-box protein [Deltaproteobacteria bacterium]
MQRTDTGRLLLLLAGVTKELVIIFLDKEGIITEWMGGAEEVFGYSRDEIIGQSMITLFSPEDLEKNIPQFEREVAAQGSEAEDDRWMLRKDGARFWAAGLLVPLSDSSGELLGFAKILRNRTDIKGLIEVLESQSESGKESSERKNLFISTLAHELRNPLGSIKSALQLLDKVGAQNEQSIFARSTIGRQLDYLTRMVEDLMDVSRIEKGKVKLEKCIMPLNDVLKDAAQTCYPYISTGNHEFHLIMTNSEVYVEVDPARIKQVFVNLIHNATKFTAERGKIWVKLDIEGNSAMVRVEDTGHGIAPELLPLIFDLFTQAHDGQLSDGQGLGLGLSVVKNLVTMHGGSVSVKSDGIGKGSQFTVRLPLAGPDLLRSNRPC